MAATPPNTLVQNKIGGAGKSQIQYAIVPDTLGFQFQRDSTQLSFTIQMPFLNFFQNNVDSDDVPQMMGYSKIQAGPFLGGNIVAATWAAGTATYTTQVPHGLAGNAGDRITVTGVTPDAFNENNTLLFLVLNPTQFEVFGIPNPGGPYVTGGYVTGPKGPQQSNYLHRELPWQCPLVSWLWLVSLTNGKGVKPLGKMSQSKFAPNLTGGDYQEYEWVEMLATFSTLPYNRIIGDTLLANVFNGDESERYVEKMWRPTAEYISVDRGLFQFAEGPLKNPKGNPFLLGTGRVTVKVDLEWVWHDVPHDYIYSKDNYPANLANGLGRVNLNPVWGYAAGTLLCLGAEIVPTIQPVSPNVLGLQGPGIQPRQYNVKFLFKFWDPELGRLATTHGHNVAMNPGDGLFYLIRPILKTYPRNLLPQLFQAYDFLNFFRAVPSNA
jgi:hypothetical protein